MADAVALGTPLRLVGRPLPRHDARDKVAAATAYAADWAMPGMLHAAVLRSPYPSARIVKLETDRKSTRLNSSHGYISYAVFCLKKKKRHTPTPVHRSARLHVRTPDPTAPAMVN